MKFEYDWYVYCLRELASSCLSFSFFVHFSFSSVKFSVTDFSDYIRASLQILCTHWEWPIMLWERKPRCWDLSLSSFSISHFNVIHRGICVKRFLRNDCLGLWNFVQMLGMTFFILSNFQVSHFSLIIGTVRPAKLKPHMHNGNVLIYCVYQNQAPSAYFCPFIHCSVSN